LFNVLIKLNYAGQERLVYMNSTAIGPESAASDFGIGAAPTGGDPGKMAPTTDGMLQQIEMPPPPGGEEAAMPPNLSGAPEDYNTQPSFSCPPKTDLPSTDPGKAPSGDTTTQPDGEEGDGAADGEVTYDELLDNPDVLQEAGTNGLEITGMELTLESDGMLSENSKEKVNELIGYMTDTLGGIEVVANAYTDENSNNDVSLHLTAGENNSVTYYPKENTVYSSHTHPSGYTNPSQTDLDYEIEGAQDAIVPADGIPGNEDGSDYYVYA
jgi:proteasome lid subunit RPN8/RPN11